MRSAYESLHVINQATEQITEHIDRLKTDGLINAEQGEILKLTAKATRAVACHSAILGLTEREMSEAWRADKDRIEIEEHLKSS